MGLTSYEKVKTWRDRARFKMLESFGNQCGICLYNKSNRALSFHHIDSETKELKLCKQSASWKRIVTELRKCVLLCANCHMEVHDNITEIPKDIPRFNESYATYVNSQGRLIGG